jgi:very-short-patch-repair endonuclease
LIRGPDSSLLVGSIKTINMKRKVKTKLVKKPVVLKDPNKVKRFVFNKPVLEKWIEELKKGNTDRVIREILLSIEKKEKTKVLYKKDSRIRVPRVTTRIAEEFRSRLIDNITVAEKTFGQILREYNIEFEFQKIFYYYAGATKRFYIVDFYVPQQKLIIEIDGGYHNETETQKLDEARTDVLLSTGIADNVVRLLNEDVISFNNKIKQVIYNMQQGRYIKKISEVNGTKIKQRVAKLQLV